MRDIAYFQNIYIQADIDIFGEEAHDLAADFAPRAALVQRPKEPPHFIYLDSGIVESGIFYFASIPVAHAYGQQAAYPPLLRSMIKYGGMRIAHPLVRRPQIRMRIQMQKRIPRPLLA
jgi:hypothetical protein